MNADIKLDDRSPQGGSDIDAELVVNGNGYDQAHDEADASHGSQGVQSVSATDQNVIMQAQLEAGNESNDVAFRFAPQMVNLGETFYELTLILLTMLICFWDIAVPIAMYETMTGSKEAAMVDERPYNDTPIWPNYNILKNEFGPWFVILVTVHVGCALMAFPSYFAQLFCIKLGSKQHKICGVFILGVVTLLWAVGGTAAGVLIAQRGFYPKRYKIDGVTGKTSFSFSLYLQFVYDGALLNECLMHGMAARMLLGGVDRFKDKEYRYKAILKMWHLMCLGFLPLSSIFLYCCRTIMMSIIVFHYGFDASGNQIMLALYLLEFALIPLTNVANLRFVKNLYQHYNDIQSYVCDKDVKRMISYHHGGALTIAGFVVLWTFVANVVYVWGNNGAAAIAYIVMMALLLFWWFVWQNKCMVCSVGCPWCTCLYDVCNKIYHCQCWATIEIWKLGREIFFPSQPCADKFGCTKCCQLWGKCLFFCCNCYSNLYDKGKCKCIKCITCYDKHQNDPKYIPLCCCAKQPSFKGATKLCAFYFLIAYWIVFIAVMLNYNLNK